MCRVFLVAFAAVVATCVATPLRHWVIAPVDPTSDCVCDGVGPEPTPTVPCYCFNGTYEYTAPNSILGSFLGTTATEGPVIAIDPFFDENVNTISPTPFWKKAWWFNTTTTIAPANLVLLVVNGLNYRADIMVNGVTIATNDVVVGTFRRFAFDITAAVMKNHATSIAIKVHPPVDHTFPPNATSTDLAITFVDWNPEPADRTMGLIDTVEVVTHNSPFEIVSVLPTTRLSHNGTANVALMIVMKQWAPVHQLHVAMKIKLGFTNDTLTALVPTSTTPKELRVWFNCSLFVELCSISSTLLWNPWQMGQPHMHSVVVSLDVANHTEIHYEDFIGLREVTSAIDRFGSRQFVVNGHPIQIRGGGWSPDMYYRSNDTLLHLQFQLVRDMNLNAVRLEGKFMWKGFFDLADRMGLMVLPGWCCCDSWQHWSSWGPEQFLIAGESLRAQLRRLGSHPSVITFFYSSDELPPEPVERLYLDVFEEEAWPNPVVSSASATPSNITGPSGVKMSGPYAWVPPVYWLQDSNQSFADAGGAWGFLTEGGPGASPLLFDSWNRTVPANRVWSNEGMMSEAFSFHCASPKGMFRDMRFFVPPLDARYGNSSSARSALYRSQIQSFESMRAMFEGYTRNKHTGATGVIQWMMNNAWPSHIWHLFDFYLAAGGSYYGAKRACAPLQVILSYVDGTVSIVNSMFEPVMATNEAPIIVQASIFSLHGEKTWNAVTKINSALPADAAVSLPELTLPIPLPQPPSSTYFVRLEILRSDSDSIINDYWIAQQMDVMNWTETHWYITFTSQLANFTQLNSLPPVAIDVSAVQMRADARGGVSISCTALNEGNVTAFGVRPVVRLGAEEIHPAMWSDSFFILMPGESRKLSTWIPHMSATSLRIRIEMESYNEEIQK